MPRLLIRYAALLILVFTLTSITAFCQSSSAAIPAAPIPAQMINGKNVFISNLMAENGALIPVTEHRAYDAFYAAIKSGGQYHLVSTPEEADLVFQLRTNDFVQLTIIDPHSNIALWAISRDTSKPSTYSISDIERNMQSATVALASDLQKLIASATPSTTAGK